MKFLSPLVRRIRRSDAPAPQSAFEAADVFANGLFPVCPATHDLGIRRLFDLSTLLLLLDCRPGDRVLDLGAGPGFSAETLARLGYDVVAVDPDVTSLRHARHRAGIDRTRIDGRVTVAGARAEALPFAESSFDGILGMNVLHHVSDMHSSVGELRRVLRPGCRAVFAEPGLDHLEADETQRAIREHGETDLPFDVIAFLRIARANGFSDAMLSATLHPPLRLLPLEEIELYTSGRHSRPHLTAAGVIDELHRRHPFAMLTREGSRAKTSRHPGILAHDMRVDGMSSMLKAGVSNHVRIVVTNTGDTIWEAKPNRLGGFVTVGCKLIDCTGALVNDRVGRTFLPHSVSPGDSVTVDVDLTIPAGVAKGQYELRFDMVDEMICWFSDASGNRAVSRSITVH